MSDWIELAPVSDFEKTDRKYFELDEFLQVIVFKIDDEYLCVEAWCTHQKVSMVMADVDGHEIVCPLHGGRFDVRNGKPLCQPVNRGLETFPLMIEDGKIFVEADLD